MKIRWPRLSALVALLAITLSATAQAKPSTVPTPGQVRAAVRQAARSKDLWATVNICNTMRFPNTIGIRGQMPSLGFSARLQMRFGVDYWSGKAFTPLPGLLKSIDLGQAASGADQAGVKFTFSPHAGILRGAVTYEWRFRQRLIGQATRLTRLGHRNADYGDPKGFSSWRCVIP